MAWVACRIIVGIVGDAMLSASDVVSQTRPRRYAIVCAIAPRAGTRNIPSRAAPSRPQRYRVYHKRACKIMGSR